MLLDAALPFFERAADRPRELLDEVVRRPDEVDRALDELREAERPREFDALRGPERAFVALPLLLDPFPAVLRDRFDVVRRRLVLAFACAICPSFGWVLSGARRPIRVLSGYPRLRTGNGGSGKPRRE